MPGEHILIVDDERAIQTTLRGVLEDEGYRVTAVGSGEQALARLQDDTPDIIFLDIWMPGIVGSGLHGRGHRPARGQLDHEAAAVRRIVF
ncbi:MAG TPA: response regulator, partial [Candidatus Eisenbacteria bacterium]|nr:response regulator [Candidatus Eisenbacteria bacterium]